MTMHMNHTFHNLRTTLPRFAPTFVAAASRQPALAPFADPPAALAALEPASSLDDRQRDAVIRALVAENQASKHPLWPAMLLLAFEPAVRRLARHLGNANDEEIDQLVVASFWEAIGGVRADTRAIVLAIRREAARKVYQSLRRARPAAAQVSLEDLVDVAEVPWHRDQTAFVQCAAREVLRACEKVPGAAEVLLARAGIVDERPTAEPLREDLPASERSRMLCRLRHRRQRTVARVRRALGSGQ